MYSFQLGQVVQILWLDTVASVMLCQMTCRGAKTWCYILWVYSFMSVILQADSGLKWQFPFTENHHYQFFYFLWSIGHPWRASKHCDLQLSPWPHSMIFLYFLLCPLLSFATFSSTYLFFYIPEDSNPMQFSLLLLLLYVMCVLSSSIFFFLSEFLSVSVWWFSIVLRL